MGRSGKRGREEAETYDSDGGFVSNEEKAPKKKSKKETASKADDENPSWEVSRSNSP
jgi:hypothetical protein